MGFQVIRLKKWLFVLLVAVLAAAVIWLLAAPVKQLMQGKTEGQPMGSAAFPLVASSQEAQGQDKPFDLLLPRTVTATAQGDGESEEPPSEAISIRIKQVQDDYPGLQTAGGVEVLLYHTHTFEAYQNTDGYAETEKWRTRDGDHNITAVGAELARQLGQLGVNVCHDTTDCETPKLGTAYVRSLALLESLTRDNPEAVLAIDMHRDAKIQGDGQADTVTAPDGTQLARLMFVVGTAEKGDFAEKPDWENNYKLALSLTNRLNEMVPGLAKEVTVRSGRYNQHACGSCLLVEVGHNENTLQQAKAAMPYLAAALAEVMSEGGGQTSAYPLIPRQGG